jgi:hypothetical protein
MLGSGGRAAVALSSLSPTTTLHTYAADSERFSLTSLLPLAEQTHATWRPHPIIFSYFHPLSRPVIQPRPIEPQEVIRVSGEAILRFGFLEGDAVVSGHRVVYDPQTDTGRGFHRCRTPSTRIMEWVCFS